MPRARDLALLIVSCSAAALAMTTNIPRAAACVQLRDPEPGVVDIVSVFGGRIDVEIPKDGAVRLDVYSGPITDDVFRAKVKVTAAVNGTPVTGDLVRAAQTARAAESIWLWKPTSVLPVGALALQLSVDGADGVKESSHALSVTDTLLAVPKAAVSVELARTVRAVASSPQIKCKGTFGGGCGQPSKEQTVATQYEGAPVVAYQIHDASSPPNQNRFDLMKTTLRVFSRDANGVETLGQELTSYAAPTGGTAVPHADAEYCASVTVTSLLDPSKEEKTEVCRPHGSLDLMVSDAEQTKLVQDALVGCADPIYPAGYSTSNPAGAPTGSSSPSEPTDSNGGCAVSGAASGSMAGAWLVGAAMLLVRRRRSLR